MQNNSATNLLNHLHNRTDQNSLVSSGTEQIDCADDGTQQLDPAEDIVTAEVLAMQGQPQNPVIL